MGLRRPEAGGLTHGSDKKTGIARWKPEPGKIGTISAAGPVISAPAGTRPAQASSLSACLRLWKFLPPIAQESRHVLSCRPWSFRQGRPSATGGRRSSGGRGFSSGRPCSFWLPLAWSIASPAGVDALVTGSPEHPSGLGLVINLAFGTLISMGATAFYIAAHDNPDGAELSMLWHPRPFWKYLGVSILLAIVVGVGLALLIVPGIILLLDVHVLDLHRHRARASVRSMR